MPPQQTPASALRVTFARVVCSEWVKVRSLRATGWGLALLALSYLVLGFIPAVAAPFSLDQPAEASRALVVAVATIGIGPAQLVIAVLGVLAIGGEYSSGSIRASLIAVPSRLPVLFAKVLVLAVVTALTSLAAAAATIALTAPILIAKGYQIHPEDDSVVFPVLGGAVYLSLIAVLAIAIGAIVRHTAGALAVVLTPLLVLPTLAIGIVSATKSVALENLVALLPSTAGQALYLFQAGSGGVGVHLLPWQGLLIVLSWSTVGAVLATLALMKRDTVLSAGHRRRRVGLPARGLATSRIHHGVSGTGRLSFANVVLSEWVKFRSVRSTGWCYATIVVVIAGYGCLRAATVRPLDVGGSIAEATDVETMYAITAGIGLAQLIVAVLGVVIISGEYTTGSIRSTLTAVPRRLPVFFGKLVVLAVTTAVVSGISLAITAAVIVPVHLAGGFEPRLLDPAVASPILRGTLYLSMIGILALAIGTILRSAVGGIATMVTLLIVLPSLFNILSRSTNNTDAAWIGNLGRLLPASGDQFYQFIDSAHHTDFQQFQNGTLLISPEQGVLIVLAWLVAGLIVAIVALRHRDTT